MEKWQVKLITRAAEAGLTEALRMITDKNDNIDNSIVINNNMSFVAI